ncbi:hypothetical protein [uncultured Clostridium sp.]|uniref:hypothetical protein n=1 Tax=uncultured Clostridium sp. TaxID=59620 RepID=UPI0025CE9518|nr:hypothetical protein [uncultured Clostridium sp.]
MNYPDYYIVKLKNNVDSILNKRVYSKGERIMVWHNKLLNNYWVVNFNDVLGCEDCERLYALEVNEK